MSRRNSCNLSQKAIDWIYGELLGDGYLRKGSCRATLFSYASKYLEYAEYVRDTLNSFGIEQVGRIYKRHLTHRNMNCYTYDYVSRAYPELLVIRKKWYPKGKKIVPRDIKLTPLTVRQWYIGDGSLVKSKFITLYTQCFTVYDVNWLVKQLRKLGFKANRQKRDNTIRISNKNTRKTSRDFLDYIGKCPVKCYKYKWLLKI